tara:strand:+ start:297 stop:506 length:210 start_codon:yes stop_codon:yes gene_type:complete
MISTSDGSQPNELALAFAKQYAKEFQEEKEALNKELVKSRSAGPGEMALKGTRGQDLRSKIASGVIKIL